MDSTQWDKLKKDMARAKKLMQQAGVPGILLQLRWGSLSKAQRKKIEQAAKGQGWWGDTPGHREARLKVALKAQGEGAINEPIEVKEPAHEENPVPQKEETMESTTKQAGIDLTGLVADEEYHKLRMAEGALKGKTAFRCPECNRGLSLHKSGKLVCGEHGTLTSIDKAIDLRKIGKDKETTKWAKNEYEGWLAEAKTEGYPTVGAYVNSMEDNRKDSYKEYARLGTGLEKIFNPDASKKEPPLITDPLRKSYDPTFEQSEDERMKEEASQEPEEDTVDYYDTGKLTKYDLDDLRYSPYPEGMQSPEEEEFSDLFAEAVFTGAINTEPSPNKLLNPESIRSRWQSFFYKDPEGTIKELKDLIKKQKPKGKEEITVSFDSLIATPKLKKDLKKPTDEELVALHKKVKYSSHHDAIDQELTSRGYFKKREQQELRAKYASIPKEKLEGLLNFYKNDKDKDSFINEIEVIREILKK